MHIEKTNLEERPMKIIEATQRNKKHTQTVRFTIGGEHFEARYHKKDSGSVELFHAGQLIGKANQADNPKTVTVYSGEDTLNLKFWCNITPGRLPFLPGGASGMGLEVNDRPVQHTVADPGVQINQGKTALYILVGLLLFKSVYVFAQNMLQEQGLLVSLIAVGIYLVPLAIVLTCIFTFDSVSSFALWAGMVISIIEVIDYSVGLVASILNHEFRFSFMLLFWIWLRISMLHLLYNSLHWLRKRRDGI
ncbi:MAG: hypothetical protein KDK37_16335 [Leptospiraceae bacterium]|nr:hypothetical protein [Leptospiraceae bacterium]